MRPVRKADNLPPPCVVMKSGNLNFLEPSGPLQACNGTALPLPCFYGLSSLRLNALSLRSVYACVSFVRYSIRKKKRGNRAGFFHEIQVPLKVKQSLYRPGQAKFLDST